MGDQENKKPAAPQLPEGAKASSTGSTEKKESFEKEVDKLTEKYKEKAQQQRSKFTSVGSTGRKKAEVITARQQNQISKAAYEKKEQYKKLTADQRKARMSIMLGETEQEMINLHELYEEIINFAKGLNKLDDNDLVKLEAIMGTIRRMKANPAMEKLFLKALNKTPFDEKEMEMLVNKISPTVLGKTTDSKNSNAIFETSNVGAIIGVMEEGQKMKLVEMIIQKKSPEAYMQILDSFIVSGVLSNIQLNNLIERGIIPEPHVSKLKSQLENGEIQAKQREYHEKIINLGKVNKGRTTDNPVNKMISGPGAMAVAGLLGVATALINAKANWDWSNIGKSIGDTVTNPYFLLGSTAAVGGALVVAPAIAPERYEKYKEKFLDFWKGPEAKQEKLATQKVELREMLEDKMKNNIFLMDFLAEKEEMNGSSKTGLEIIKEHVSANRSAKKSISFNFEDIKGKCGRKQQELLEKAYMAEGSKDINFQDSMRAVMAVLTALKLDTPKELASIIKELKAKQGIK